MKTIRILIIPLCAILTGCIINKKESFYAYIKHSDTEYSINWGIKGEFSNTTKNKFKYYANQEYQEACLGINSIVLESGCGSECKSALILPLIKNKSEIIIEDYFLTDCKLNTLITIGDNGEDLFIGIINLNGNIIKRDTIKGKDLCPAAIKRACVDTAYIEKNNLIVKWQGSNWTSEKSDYRDRKIKLEN